jgi:hypothetical protein
MPRDDPSLIQDDNQPDTPGLHALLIGVSRYPHLTGGEEPATETFGLGQLSSPASTAKLIADRLLAHKDRLTPKLKTLRMLVSPSPAEAALPGPEGALSVGNTLADLSPATLTSVRKAARRWRQDASIRKDDATFFYFGGHGIQRSRGDAVLLLEDVLEDDGAPILERAIDVNNLYNGMGNPTLPNMAQTQFYFIDACRSSVAKFKNLLAPATAQVFDIDSDGTDDRVAPVLFAAAAGHEAYGPRGEPSLFGRDLVACLDGGAGEFIRRGSASTWVLTIGELVRVLSALSEAYNLRAGTKLRTFDIDKFTRSLQTTLRTLEAPPVVKCSFSIDPEQARAAARLILKDAASRPAHTFPNPPLAVPYTCELPTGHYAASAAAPGASGEGTFIHEPEFLDIRAPTFEYTFRMIRNDGDRA